LPEPNRRQPNLRDNHTGLHWRLFLNWAEANTAVDGLSCLAAQQPSFTATALPAALDDKQVGFFDDRKVSEPPADERGTSEPMRSLTRRWNEVREEALTSVRYSVLTVSRKPASTFCEETKKAYLFIFPGAP